MNSSEFSEPLTLYSNTHDPIQCKGLWKHINHETLPTKQQVEDIVAKKIEIYPWLENEIIWWMQGNGMYEILTYEYIEHLCEYIISIPYITEDTQTKILEIAAGNGKLSHYLQKMFHLKYPDYDIDVLATDNASSPIYQSFPVENIDYQDALTQYQPSIAICSWMPPSIDFTKNIRACKSVTDYILIGDGTGDEGENIELKNRWEENGGYCGDRNQTWGLNENNQYPWEVDGFELVKSTGANMNVDPGHNSKTLCFQRKK